MPLVPTFAPIAKNAKKSPTSPTAARSPSKKDAGKDAKPSANFSFANIRIHGDAQPASPISGDQLKSNGDCSAPLPAGLPAKLSSLDGQPLPDPIKQSAQQDFGIPFDQVRLHTGRDAHRMANGVHAKAFTYGNDIAFRAGQYAPHTPEGRRLLWHELGHVAAGPKSMTTAGPVVPQVLRAPLYDLSVGSIGPIPPSAGITTAYLRGEVDKKKKNGDITAYTISGVKAGASEELFLLNVLYQWGQKDRWDTSVTLHTAVGYPDPKTQIAPKALVKLTIDDKGSATVELVPMALTAPLLAPGTLTDAQAIGVLQKTFGIASVDAGDKAWANNELNDVVLAYGRLPGPDVAALKGVKLIRNAKLPNGWSGLFSPGGGGVAKTPPYHTDPPTLQLADNAFDLQQKGGALVIGSERVVGDSNTAASFSYLTILHEAGHAVEAQAARPAQEAFDSALIKRNKAADSSNAALTRWKNAPKGTDTTKLSADYTSKHQAFLAAATDQGKKEKALKATQIPEAAIKAMETDATAKKGAFTAALATANTAAMGFDLQKLADAAAYRKTVDDAKAAIEDFKTKSSSKTGEIHDLDNALTAAIADRTKARKDLEKASPGNPVLATFAAVDTAQDDWFNSERMLAFAPGRSLRLQHFVDAVNAAGIKPFTKYARDNWPHNPAEFYAEAYTLWLNDPKFVQNNYNAVFVFFDSGAYRN